MQPKQEPFIHRGDITDITVEGRTLSSLATTEIWCILTENLSFSRPGCLSLSPCTHGSSQGSFFCRFDDLLDVSLNVQLLTQLTFFFALETAFERSGHGILTQLTFEGI